MPAAFLLLLAAQFVSALADNALLIVTIALLQGHGMPSWWAPLLKVAFIASYVVLAPFVGPLADAFPKARLMAWMNAVKLLGVAGLIVGVHPLAAFVVVGLGAAAYAPAKYGLATELVRADQLVVANGWIEVAAVCAVLLGTGLGGLLVSPWLLSALNAPGMTGLLATGGLGPLFPSLLALLGVYLLAGALNLGVPDTGIRYPVSCLHPLTLVREFMEANRRLWRDRDGGLSLAVTTLFWGVGATLQFAVLRWGSERMHLPLDRAAFVQAAVAIGVIFGALAAGAWIPLARAKRMLYAGVVFGVLMTVFAFVTALEPAIALLVTVGAVGGLMIVPMNALLQDRGNRLLSAGRSIAIQGANENASVLCFLGVYAALVAMDVPLVALMAGLGLCVAGVLVAFIVRESGRERRGAARVETQTAECSLDARA
jgi:LPLT family lysophospholipid transporter-like MFS transporter